MRVSTKQFTYDKNTRGFVTEASNLCPIDQRLFHRVWPDSCDMGIILTSHITGIDVEYVVEHVETSVDNEVLYWLLKPTPESTRKVPQARHTYVRIFND